MRLFALGVLVGVAAVGVPIAVALSRFIRELDRSTGWG